MDEITTSAYVDAGIIAVTGSVINNGQTTISSFDLHYSIDNGTTVTENVTGLSIPSFSSYNFEHSTGWSETNTGQYLLKCGLTTSMVLEMTLTPTTMNYRRRLQSKNLSRILSQVIPAQVQLLLFEVIADGGDQVAAQWI